MARKIEVDLTADTKSFERSMASAGAATEKFESDLKSADGAASRFDAALDTTTGKLGSTTNGMRSTADLAGGLGNVLGIEVLGQAEMFATGIADMADGLGGLLAPALTKAKAAFLAMNTTLMANPIFLVIAALVALTAAFVIAYKKSETFRNIVDGALKWVKNSAKATLDYISNAVTSAAKVIAKIADIITTPYQLAFRGIASLWNNTVGRLSFSIPSWVPGIGGAGFDVPDIPMLAKGGIVNGPTLAMVGERGPEAVIPLTGSRAGSMGATRVEIVLSGDRELVELMRRSIKDRGGNVQTVLGSN